MITVKTIIKNKLWVSATIAFVAILVIPFILSFFNPSYVSMPEGAYIKSGNRIFYNFLENVKQTNGILVLGTSETGNGLNGNNYYSILNRDNGFKKSVYSLGGAGRTANVYFPLILDNPQAFDNLDIIYYINPTYWRIGLNNFSSDYFNRYVDAGIAIAVKNKAQKANIYDKFIKEGAEKKAYFPFLANRIADNFKSFYYYNLIGLLTKNKPTNTVKLDINNYYSKQKIEDFKHKINLDYNATDEFLKKELPFLIIDTNSTYQYEMLLGFIQLTKKYNINCKFYLGPYNEIYCNKKSPKFKKEHQEVIKKIIHLLTTNNVEFIDGSIQSNIPGTFIDVQHISEYGAYLTALQIKEYYEKTE